jgi:UDP-glucose 4-epimerase
MTRVLVTGGAGFIGSHLVRELVRSRYDVVVLDNFRRGRRERIDESAVEVIEGDVRDLDALACAAGCRTIFHLAAQSNVMGALDDPEYSFASNTLGTFNVLRAAVEHGVPRVVFTSSREVYGEAQYTPVDEDHALGAKNPYGASKIAGEAYCRSFANCHDVDVAIFRLANVYGPDDTERVIPLWLDDARAGRELSVFGGSQILDFVWIATVVRALIVAGEEGLPSITNIGSGTGTTIFELGRRILQATKSASTLTRLPARPAEVTRFVADVSRMRALGIEPEPDPLAHLRELVATTPVAGAAAP